jgi:glycerol kinase
MPDLVGAIDQGTSSTRFMIFDEVGSVVAMAQEEHRQIFPRPGWVEHDPEEIWDKTRQVIAEALAEADVEAPDLRAVGITNQRETAVVWDRHSGEPVANAIVWQDTRTADLCEELAGDEGMGRFAAKTGLPLATYFSGPKVRWLLDDLDLLDRAKRGDLLMDLVTTSWDADLCTEIGVPTHMLPEIVPSVGEIGTCREPLDGVPLAAMLGDQQAAMFGQACFRPGEAKNTYGTGNFMLLNTGTEPVTSEAGLLTTVCYSIAGDDTTYALEGSIAVTGSLIQWLRDDLGIIASAAEAEDLARSVEDNADVFFVPAFSGLYAPYWRQDARGVIVGLTRFANKGHIARAALEAAAYQSADVLEAMVSDSGVELTELRVDGGMTENDLLMQFQADLLGVDVVRPMVTETTALGAAYGAGLASGVWPDLDRIHSMWAEDARWSPRMDEAERTRLHGRWREAVERSFGWA